MPLMEKLISQNWRGLDIKKLRAKMIFIEREKAK